MRSGAPMRGARRGAASWLTGGLDAGLPEMALTARLAKLQLRQASLSQQLRRI